MTNFSTVEASKVSPLWVVPWLVGNYMSSERSTSASIHLPTVHIYRYWHVIESSRRIARIELIVLPVPLEWMVLLLLLLLLWRSERHPRDSSS